MSKHDFEKAKNVEEQVNFWKRFLSNTDKYGEAEIESKQINFTGIFNEGKKMSEKHKFGNGDWQKAMDEKSANDFINEESTEKQFIQRYKKALNETIEKASQILDIIKNKDPNFDADYKIESGLSRVSSAIPSDDIDFRNLTIKDFKLDNEILNTKNSATYISISNEDNFIHIYKPEVVVLDKYSEDSKNDIIITLYYEGCQLKKTSVIDASTWLNDTEDLGVKQNISDMSDYIYWWCLDKTGRYGK